MDKSITACFLASIIMSLTSVTQPNNDFTGCIFGLMFWCIGWVIAWGHSRYGS
nr:MAG TPA: hypothetical protein [Caudoviricetes sp.]